MSFGSDHPLDGGYPLPGHRGAESGQEEQVGGVLASLRRTCGNRLLAVYLHGSAVSSGLQHQSDIDLLAVVDRPLTGIERAALSASLLRLSGTYPSAPSGPRCLEVTVFSQPELGAHRFPVRAEFLYGEWLRPAFEAGESTVPVQSAELTLLLAQARREAVPLVGPEKDALLPEIPEAEVRKAMRQLLPDLLADLPTDTRNVLLTLSRMWRTAVIGDFVSKADAAIWTMPQLTERNALTLEHARRAYLGEVSDTLTARFEDVSCLVDELAAKVDRALTPGSESD